MAGITKLLGIAIADADARRITRGQLLKIFQDAINNGDILEEDNQLYVVSAILPLVDAGALSPSIHVDTFAKRMNAVVASRLHARHSEGEPEQPSRGQGPSRRETIVSLADATGRTLHTYIAIHNDIFGGGLVRGLRRLLPIPGFFQAIDFVRHQHDLDQLAHELDDIKARIKCADGPLQLSTPLHRYCEALWDTVAKLHGLTSKLAGRRDAPDSYNAKQYKTDLAEYEKAVVEYRSVGADLNRAFRAVLS